MISYHPKPYREGLNPAFYTSNWRTADLDPVKDFERLQRCILTRVWSPIIWNKAYRLQNNFMFADWCGLDFDDGEMTLDEAKRTFCDMIHIIGTTKSHQKKKNEIICDRFRVVLRFSERISDLATYRYNMQKCKNQFPIDKACSDGARVFYPCTAIVQASSEGYLHDVVRPRPEIIAPSQESYVRIDDDGNLPPWVRVLIEERIIPQGERNMTIYRMAKDCARVGLYEGYVANRIINSKTYGGNPLPEIKAAIKKQVSRGFKAVAEEKT